MRGTILNTATVAVGSGLGLLLGRALPAEAQHLVMSGLGLVTVGMAVRMFLVGKNVFAVAAAIALGGLLGFAMGLHEGLALFAHWAERSLGAAGPEGRFAEGLVTASVLFCVGPMTLLGCLQDGLEGRSELLSVKATLDGFASIFLAAALGPGVFFSAVVILLVQGLMTAAARPLRPLAKNSAALVEMEATGGAILLAIGLQMLGVVTLPVANYLPALALAPLLARGLRRFASNVSPGP